MEQSHEHNVAERIRNRFDQLTRAERQLANAMLENYPISGLGSITAIAERSNVSTPTVVRMSKKLGFKGFPELQTALRGELEARISNPISKHERWTQNAPDTHILNRFADAVMDNLRSTLKQINPETFNAVVDLLSDPTHAIHVVGGRITNSMAGYFFNHMQVMRSGVTHVASNSNTWPHYVLNMKAGDILLAFDIRRYEHNLLRLAKMAKAKDVTLILITDQWGSPVAKFATHSFYTRIMAPSAWDSSVIILFLVEALITGVENANWDETKARMNTLEELFDQTKMFKKFR